MSLGSSQSISFGEIGVDKETVLKQVSLMIHEPSLPPRGSWRRTAVVHVTVAPWSGHAAAVRRGPGGAGTRRAHPRGSSRPTVYRHAPRVGQAVARAQAGGLRDDALWHDNERCKADHPTRWQAWADAEDGCLGALEQRTGLRNAPRTTQAEYVPTKR